MATITYDDKVALYENSDIADINKVSADDMNEIKDVINENSINVGVEEPTEEKVWVEYSNNLFDKDTITSGYYLGEDGEAATNSTTFYSDYIAVEPSTTYSITGKNSGWTNTAIYDSSKTFISRVAESNNILATTSSTYYIRTNGKLADLDTIMINPGSTALDYEAYTQSTININNNGVYEKLTDTLNVGTEENGKCRVNVLKSKNLIDTSYITDTSIITNNGDGSITVNGTGVGGVNFAIEPFVLKANTTYTLSLTNYYSSNEYFIFALRSDESTNLVQVVGEAITYTPTEDTTINYFRIFTSGGITFSNYTTAIQLEVGSTATDYQPYGLTSISVDGDTIYQTPVVLWQNSSPTSSFATQTITLSDDIENYSYYEVIYKRVASGSTYQSSGRIPSSFRNKADMVDGGYMYNRTMSSISSTSMTFGDAGYYGTYGSSTTTTSNAYLIPYQVIGYK